MANTGQQGYKILEGYYTDNGADTGFIMPNIQMISPQAIVPSTAIITYNELTDVVPTGGSNGDIWYNQPSDLLYKKASGIWSTLNDRVPNAYYQAPIENLTDCPI